MSRTPRPRPAPLRPVERLLGALAGACVLAGAVALAVGPPAPGAARPAHAGAAPRFDSPAPAAGLPAVRLPAPAPLERGPRPPLVDDTRPEARLRELEQQRAWTGGARP